MAADTFQVGHSQIDITPPLGSFMPGYFIDRRAKAVLDPLRIVCLAFSDGANSALVLQIDCEGLSDETIGMMQSAIKKATGVGREAVLLHASHTHDGGHLMLGVKNGSSSTFAPSEADRTYRAFAVARAADAAVMALADLKPAHLSIGRSEAKRISFGRNYLMKDGRVVTNPGVGNTDIVAPTGDPPDEEVQVVRIDRAGGKPIAVINFQTHPDVVGGETLTADWPGLTRTVFAAATLGEAEAIVLNGCQGDVNHCNVLPRPGEQNGLTRHFDGVDRGYDHARHMANVIAGAALSVWMKCEPVKADGVCFLTRSVKIPANKPQPGDAKDVAWAQKTWAAHEQGRDSELPWTGMELTTEIARARRILNLADAPDAVELPVHGIAIGDMAFVGFPGEPFNGIGKEIKSASPFRMTILMCLTNGMKGYFPNADAYGQGGYESASSPYGPSVARNLVDGSLALLKGMQYE